MCQYMLKKACWDVLEYNTYKQKYPLSSILFKDVNVDIYKKDSD